MLPTATPGQPPLNDLDRRIVAALQVNGRATWQQIAHAVDASESTVSRRANRLLREGTVRVVGITDPLRCGLGSSVLVRVECTVGAAGSVARALATRSDVRFLALLTGTYDLVLEVVVSSREHLAGLLLDEVNSVPGITRTTTENVVRNFKTAYDWSRILLGEQADQLAACAPSQSCNAVEPMTLDPVDMQLVELLGIDGRLGVAELAIQVSVSESAIRRRMERLTSSGALRFGTLVDPRLMGYHCELFLWLTVDLNQLEQVACGLAQRSEVRYLSATVGYSDLTAEVIMRDLDDVYRFNTEVLATMPGIRQMEVGRELQTAKRGYLTAPLGPNGGANRTWP